MSASTVSPRGDRRLAVRAIDVAGPVVHHCLGRATCPVVAVPLEAPAKIHKIADLYGSAGCGRVWPSVLWWCWPV